MNNRKMIKFYAIGFLMILFCLENALGIENATMFIKKNASGQIIDSVNNKNIIELNGKFNDDNDFIEFNGKSWIITTKPIFKDNNDVTFQMEIKFKTDKNIDQAMLSGISGKSTHIVVGVTGKRIVFMTYAGKPDYLMGKSEVTDGQWHKLAVTYDKNSLTKSIYVDGKLEANKKITGISGKSNGWRIGKQSEFHPLLFNGEIEYIKITDELKPSIDVEK